jgi:hypothetical protein
LSITKTCAMVVSPYADTDGLRCRGILGPYGWLDVDREELSKGVSQGRVTAPVRHRGNHTGRYVSPEQSGRVTTPIDHSHDASPRWFGPTILVLLLLGVLLILLNYLAPCPVPRAPGTWSRDWSSSSAPW